MCLLFRIIVTFICPEGKKIYLLAQVISKDIIVKRIWVSVCPNTFQYMLFFNIIYFSGKLILWNTDYFFLLNIAVSVVISYEDDHKLEHWWTCNLGLPVQKQLLALSGCVYSVSEGLLLPWVSHFGIPVYAQS